MRAWCTYPGTHGDFESRHRSTIILDEKTGLGEARIEPPFQINEENLETLETIAGVALSHAIGNDHASVLDLNVAVEDPEAEGAHMEPVERVLVTFDNLHQQLEGVESKEYFFQQSDIFYAARQEGDW